MHKFIPVVTAPTCLYRGYTTHICSCGESYIDNYVDEKGHIKSDWIVSKEATYFETGLKFIECTVCHDSLQLGEIPVKPSQEVTTGELTLIYDEETFDGDVEFIVQEITDGFAAETVAVRGYEDFRIFDITLKSYGLETQPNKNVWVKLPLPENYNEETTGIYYVNDENGELIKMNSFVEDEYIFFEAEHFSNYAIIDESKISGPGENETPACDHICHQSGFMGFIWKILRIFQKLFKTNQYCACGVAHY